ncbi:hypothetical protein CRU99_13710, partial [Malaciobacter mytili]
CNDIEDNSSFSYKQNNIKFKVDSKEILSFSLNNFIYEPRANQYLQEGYTLKVQDNEFDFFLEYIHLSTQSKWNGQARSFYEDFFKEKLKLKSFKLLNRFEEKNYEFSTYLVNEDKIIQLIYIWDVYKDTFIFDKNGKLFNSLATKLNKQYKDSFKEYKRATLEFPYSLIVQNRVNSYFNKN